MQGRKGVKDIKIEVGDNKVFIRREMKGSSGKASHAAASVSL
jgi:hypothetical protein